MSINFYPRSGTVLICDFDTGFQLPEMVKRRPVVVLSNWQRKGSELCTVVPLSRTRPIVVREYHVLLDPNPVPNWGDEIWAKCDVVTTVGVMRLDRFKMGRDHNGHRIYRAGSVTDDQLATIERGVLHALGVAGLISGVGKG